MERKGGGRGGGGCGRGGGLMETCTDEPLRTATDKGKLPLD